MNAAALRLDKMLIRREFWENRSLWIVPAVVIGILTVLSLYMLLMILSGHPGSVSQVDLADVQHFRLDMLPDFSQIEDDRIVGMVRLSTLALASVFVVLMQIVIFFYLLDSLYAERRDRSVLFWRSMPVSDLRTVLAKLATACIASSVITFLAVIAMQLILLVLFTILGLAVGVHPLVFLAHPWAFLSSWLLMAYGLLMMTVWYLPFYAWPLLASAWAKKAPFLWAVLIPLGLFGAEGWVFHTGHLFHTVIEHKVDWLSLAFNFDPEIVKNGGELDVQGNLMGFGNVAEFLTSPRLWVGTGLAAVFTYAAIWLRRNRTEI